MDHKGDFSECIHGKYWVSFLWKWIHWLLCLEKLVSRAFNWRRQWHPTPVLLPGKSHGWKSLVGCSPWGRKESDTTERLHFHFSLSCIGEGNGSLLQCSCLENPRDGGAWWAAIYGVAQSRTQLKQLSSSSSSLTSSLKTHSRLWGLPDFVAKCLVFLLPGSCLGLLF